jgi:hypothetical protein
MMAANPFDQFDKQANTFDQFDSKPAKQKKEVGAVDRTAALAAGVNRGVASDLLGLPVDTVANVLDLGKAGVGYLTSKATGHEPPEWTQPFDRRGVVGSADWLAAKINQGSDALGVASPIDNPNPQDQASRVLHTGGRFVGSSVVPNPAAKIGATQQVLNAGKAAIGGISAGMVGEVAPEWAGVAGMSPQIIGAASMAGTKQIVRGGETGRREMAQRLQDFRNAGVENPSVGLASGNKFIMGAENLLANTPGSVGLYENNKLAMLSGLQNRANQIRNSLSPVYGPSEAGAAIQSDLKGAFKERIGGTYGDINNKFSSMLPQADRFPIPNTLNSLDAVTAVNSLAPATTGSFVQPRISALRNNILADTSSSAPVLFNTPAQNKGLPISAIKEIRTSIGKEAASNAIMGTPEQADFKSIYAGLSQDMRGAAKQSDMAIGPQPNNVGPAERMLDRGNKFYSNAMNRADKLNPLANNNTPEGAYNSVVNSLNSGPTTYARVRNAVTPDTRGKMAATVVDEMGMATPGNQGAKGDTWSPKTFLTNYNKAYENGGGQELFKRIPGGEKHAENLAQIAKVTDMISQGSKVWANPSGTAAAGFAKGTIGTIGAGAALGAFYTPLIAPAAAAAGGLLVANQASKRLLLNPKFTEWLVKAPEVKPQDAQNYGLRLIEAAKSTNDKQFQRDVSEYLSSVEKSKNESGDTANR